MLDFSDRNIRDLKLDIIFYIATFVYHIWWTSKHYWARNSEVVQIYNLSLLTLADFKDSDYLKLGKENHASISFYIIDCCNKKLLTEDEKKWIQLAMLYYKKYSYITNDDEIINKAIKQMRLDNGLL